MRLVNAGFSRRYIFGKRVGGPLQNQTISGVWLSVWRLLIEFGYSASVGGNHMRETLFKIVWRHPDREDK